jgi:hypothetical protein
MTATTSWPKDDAERICLALERFQADRKRSARSISLFIRAALPA